MPRKSISERVAEVHEREADRLFAKARALLDRANAVKEQAEVEAQAAAKVRAEAEVKP